MASRELEDTTIKNLISPVSPGYYSKWEIEPITFVLYNDLGFAEGNIIKYIMRHRDKGGAQDLDKAMRYIEMLKEVHYGKDK